ncbi:carbohydrate-binding module family 18 protein [Polychaeton citri CBS 116435]|uniref:Carbohydrate-binding module family 18 protein n=1 Tax=Polychaeton citri CBS 116435 TaxID=1314669 RepID=A0A9P4Q884_9PEZI|nr:carbohydrate-binding module family 18 protein [Polychaeton citri CBS 116435]
MHTKSASLVYLLRGQLPLQSGPDSTVTDSTPLATSLLVAYPASCSQSTPTLAFAPTPLLPEGPVVASSVVDLHSHDSTRATSPAVYTSDSAAAHEASRSQQPTDADTVDCAVVANGTGIADTSMQRPGPKCFAAFISAALGYIILSGVTAKIPIGGGYIYAAENQQWVASSRNWFDRQTCYWFGLCGVAHLRKSRWTWSAAPVDDIRPMVAEHSDFWASGDQDWRSWSQAERAERTIPPYVLDHAPYVHLFSGEDFWPCDIAEHLVHTSPRVNYTVIEEMKEDRNLTNLDELNDYDGGKNGRFIYLQSNDNVEERPRWLGGNKNIPSTPDVLLDPDMHGAWPSLDDLGDYDLEGAKQQTLKEIDSQQEEGLDAEVDPWNHLKSTDGTCGGNTGFTCEGTLFGNCCSIFGYCGTTPGHCGETCDPLSGKCEDPLKDRKPIHLDLRRRRRRELSGSMNKPQAGGRSRAPAILVVVPKDDGVVDAFWFFFYSYNLGNTVFNIRFGNHVGDWEHTVVRFKDGKPQTLFLSEHNFGEAYAWSAIEKYMPNPDGSGSMISSATNETVQRHGKRPVIYSATGTHAMYATSGLHPYVLPWGLLHDETDRGPLWDPSLNSHSYVYDVHKKTAKASTHTPQSPTNWLSYGGHWGDKYYPLSDPRQYRFAGQYHYVNGPTGPLFKNLGRKEVCQGNGECHIKSWLGGGGKTHRLPLEEDVEDGGLPGGNLTDVDDRQYLVFDSPQSP